MTLIGPRPEVPRYIPYYYTGELETLTVRPGLTGAGQIFYTQVQQAPTLGGEDPEKHYVTCELHPKLSLDLDYLRHRSLRYDLTILLRTVLVVTKLGKAVPVKDSSTADAAVSQAGSPARAHRLPLLAGRGSSAATRAADLP